MSKLEELIQQLCPDGVEYKTINTLIKTNIVKVIASTIKIKRNDYKSVGTTPIVSQEEEFISGYCDCVDKNIPKGQYICFGDHSEHIKYVDFLFVQGADGLKIMKINNLFVLPKYFYYSIANFYKRHNSYERHFKYFTDTIIPIPPIEVQREIVRILDNFTELTAELTTELTTELTARKKQYEYYRNQMMSFDCSVPIKRIGEITNVFSAARVHKNEWTSEGVPFYRSSDVISLFNGVPNSRGKAFISYELYNKLSKKSGIIKKGDVLVTGGGTIGIPFVVPTDDPIYVKDADLICIQRSDAFESKYLYHYFLTTKFKDYLSNITHNATIAHYTISQILDTPIPLPSLEEQRRIVSILDRFDALCNNLTSGLPAEIEARQKQYEYYRDKLLTFKPLA